MRTVAAPSSLDRVLRDLRREYLRTLEEPDEGYTGLDQVLEIRVAGRAHAIRLVEIRELVRVPAVVPLPSAPRGLSGVASIRGRMVAVFDLGTLLEGSPPGQARLDPSSSPRFARGPCRARLVTLRRDERLALLVEAADDVHRTPAGSIEAALTADRPAGDLLAGRLGDHRLVDVAAVIARARATCAGLAVEARP
jgi:chemotaxis signal transduction protein